MSHYRAALQQGFASHAIDCWLLWTESARIMHLPDDLLRAYGIDSPQAD